MEGRLDLEGALEVTFSILGLQFSRPFLQHNVEIYIKEIAIQF